MFSCQFLEVRRGTVILFNGSIHTRCTKFLKGVLYANKKVSVTTMAEIIFFMKPVMNACWYNINWIPIFVNMKCYFPLYSSTKILYFKGIGQSLLRVCESGDSTGCLHTDLDNKQGLATQACLSQNTLAQCIVVIHARSEMRSKLFFQCVSMPWNLAFLEDMQRQRHTRFTLIQFTAQHNFGAR